MTDLDATAKKANVKDSLKKYFVDNLETTEGLNLTFDKYLSTPKVQGHEVDRWVGLRFGSTEMSVMGHQMLDIYNCTRSDAEGFKLAQQRDKIFKYLTDSSQTDGMARIPFYRSRADGNWTLLAGGFVVQKPVIESDEIDADDGTKFQILTVTLRFSSKV